MAKTARAYWTTGAGAAEIRDVFLPEPSPGELLVETLYSAVSRGTEALVFHGRVPAGERQRMRCPHQEGDFPGPVKYGYASVGRVKLGPPGFQDGLVFCLYPHQTEYVVKEGAVVKLPEGVPARRAALAANMETALNALWDARLLPGDRVTVVGAGVVGCLAAYLARQVAAIDVELVDVRADRESVASELGVGFSLPEKARKERDVVFHASGTQSGLHTALSLAAPDSEIIELSWYGDASVELPLGAAFHSRRLSLRASQVGEVSRRARPRHTRANRLALALSLCRDSVLDVLISSEAPFAELASVMPRLLDSRSGALCHLVRYPPATLVAPEPLARPALAREGSDV